VKAVGCEPIQRLLDTTEMKTPFYRFGTSAPDKTGWRPIRTADARWRADQFCYTQALPNLGFRPLFPGMTELGQVYESAKAVPDFREIACCLKEPSRVLKSFLRLGGFEASSTPIRSWC